MKINENDIITKTEKYISLMLEKNKVMNLTSITEPDEVKVKHIEDSLSILPIIDKENPKNLLDMGTGAGLPGIILKINRPDIAMTLVDSLRKRINFLEEVSDSLNLKKLELIHSRAEDLAKDNRREGYDIVVSRAVARLDTLLEYTLPFVKVNGLFIAMKGPDADEEIKLANNAINLLGGKLEEKIELELSDGSSRTLLLIRKIKKTPLKYPRGQNKPKTKPL